MSHFIYSVLQAESRVIQHIQKYLYDNYPWVNCFTGMSKMRKFTFIVVSEITLDSVSAVDIAFDKQRYRMILHQERLLAKVVSDPVNDIRSLIVESRHGAARVLVRHSFKQQDGHDIQVNAIESHGVRTSYSHLDQPMVFNAGRSIGLKDKLLHQSELPLLLDESWPDSRWVFLHAPAQRISRNLVRYRSGFLKAGEETGKLGFIGVLPTNNPVTEPNFLDDDLPIRAKHHIKWFSEIHMSK